MKAIVVRQTNKFKNEIANKLITYKSYMHINSTV